MLPQPTSRSLEEMLKQETVQTVVHDLRTPMTVIKGNLQLLLSGMMGEMTQEQLKLLQRSVAPLEDLILMTDNLLQATTLEQNPLSLKLEEIDVDQLLAETIEFYSLPFKQREMEIYRQGNTFGTKIRVDVFWMKRVLSNLIWNAYKFTPDHGKVTVHVQFKDNGLEVIVQDTGRGIPAEKLHAIFNKFDQAAPGGDRKLGTGLGLWICKRVLQLHGGDIRVESTEGQGSRFILFFPSCCIL